MHVHTPSSPFRMRILSQAEVPAVRQRQTLDDEAQQIVRRIVARVRKEGDDALIHWTQMFDRYALTADTIEVARHVWEAAYASVSPAFLEALRLAAQNIRSYHEKQVQQSWFDHKEDGSIVGMLIRPLQRIGVYVPGGTAAYPSTVLMNVIPAVVAGVKDIVMVTPPATASAHEIHPAILVAAAEAGVTRMYRIGGAQAIAALAYGTKSVPAVDKIVGPGNRYVALAKREVYGVVDIDAVAGPSEIVIIADETANARAVAADLLSQAEHDTSAMAVCITTSAQLAQAVQEEVAQQLATLPRASIAQQALGSWGYILVVPSVEEAFVHSNALAPEHLVLHLADAFHAVHHVAHAGAIFVGPYSAESVGDYFAGPNHVLPTDTTARFFSPLGVHSFIKRSSLLHYSAQALQKNGHHIMTLAQTEGLQAHAHAIAVRLQQLQHETP